MYIRVPSGEKVALCGDVSCAVTLFESEAYEADETSHGVERVYW
jgi:hypothetical protein